MALPPWLHYAKSRENLERFTLISPPSALETLPALTLAFDCAKKTILSPTGLSTLNQTFTGGGIPPAVFEQELKELEVYVIRWLWKKKEGSYEPFHIVPKNLPNRSVGVGNIFIDILDIHCFLPKGDAVHWTESEQRHVVLMSWFILHATVEALVSILYQKRVVKPSRPLQQAFSGHSGYQCYHNGKTFGNRSWLIEDKLGGKLCLLEAEDQLFILRPEEIMCYPFTGQMVADFLSCDQDKYEALYPLVHYGPGWGFSQVDKSHLRSRPAHPPLFRNSSQIQYKKRYP